jgi:hypothetical protein
MASTPETKTCMFEAVAFAAKPHAWQQASACAVQMQHSIS